MRRLIALPCIALWAAALLATQSDTLPAALEVWERAIEAKGGRERLREIENLLMVQAREGEPDRPHFVDLWVFPDKSWRWSDDRAGYLGLRLRVFDGTGIWWALYSDLVAEPAVHLDWGPPLDQDRYFIVETQLQSLLETRWVQPEIEGLGAGRIGRREYDVVFATILGERIQYYIDRETHLVRRVGPVARFGNVLGITWDFEDYVLIDGLMMPTRMESPDGLARSWEFTFNVDYDPAIFTGQPVLENGPEGWRRER